eukprot:jgi/Botrbrau1/13334/Bobra.0334s0010.1
MVVQPDDARLAKVGFVKLEGPGIEFYAKKYEIIIGRKSKSANLDVVLGDNMNISRQHAIIAYNFDTGKWELTVLGKNGVTVDDRICLPGGGSVPLQSGSYLQLGDRGFYFLLPIEEDQLEWGYVSEGVPTQGPSRAGIKGSDMLPPPSFARTSNAPGSADEMDVTSGLSSGVELYRGGAFSRPPAPSGAVRPEGMGLHQRPPARSAAAGGPPVGMAGQDGGTAAGAAGWGVGPRPGFCPETRAGPSSSGLRSSTRPRSGRTSMMRRIGRRERGRGRARATRTARMTVTMSSCPSDGGADGDILKRGKEHDLDMLMMVVVVAVAVMMMMMMMMMMMRRRRRRRRRMKARLMVMELMIAMASSHPSHGMTDCGFDNEGKRDAGNAKRPWCLWGGELGFLGLG